MKLAIAQTLSLPFAYNAPPEVLSVGLELMYKNPIYLARKTLKCLILFMLL